MQDVNSWIESHNFLRCSRIPTAKYELNINNTQNFKPSSPNWYMSLRNNVRIECAYVFLLEFYNRLTVLLVFSLIFFGFLVNLVYKMYYMKNKDTGSISRAQFNISCLRWNGCLLNDALIFNPKRNINIQCFSATKLTPES